MEITKEEFKALQKEATTELIESILEAVKKGKPETFKSDSPNNIFNWRLDIYKVNGRDIQLHVLFSRNGIPFEVIEKLDGSTYMHQSLQNISKQCAVEIIGKFEKVLADDIYRSLTDGIYA